MCVADRAWYGLCCVGKRGGVCAYLVFGLDVQLDLLACQGADSVGLPVVISSSKAERGGAFCWRGEGVVLDVHGFLYLGRWAGKGWRFG